MAAAALGVAREGGRRGAQADCEQRLQSDRPPGVPAVVIVGASITAGVGAEDPAGSWAVLLARQLRWNAFMYRVGAGAAPADGCAQTAVPGIENRMSVPSPGAASARTVPPWRSAT